MKFLLTWFLNKRAGFYFALVGSGLFLAFLFVFTSSYGSSVYMDGIFIAFPILGFLLFLGLSFYRPIEGVGPIALAFLCMGAFCTFLYRTYGYLSEVFFAGINAEAFAAMKPEYAASFILLFLALVISIASIFIKKSVSGETKPSPEHSAEVNE